MCGAAGPQQHRDCSTAATYVGSSPAYHHAALARLHICAATLICYCSAIPSAPICGSSESLLFRLGTAHIILTLSSLRRCFWGTSVSGAV